MTIAVERCSYALLVDLSMPEARRFILDNASRAITRFK